MAQPASRDWSGLSLASLVDVVEKSALTEKARLLLCRLLEQEKVPFHHPDCTPSDQPMLDPDPSAESKSDGGKATRKRVRTRSVHLNSSADQQEGCVACGNGRKLCLCKRREELLPVPLTSALLDDTLDMSTHLTGVVSALNWLFPSDLSKLIAAYAVTWDGVFDASSRLERVFESALMRYKFREACLAPVPEEPFLHADALFNPTVLLNFRFSDVIVGDDMALQQRSGLIFPLARIHRYLVRHGVTGDIKSSTAITMALEYIASELLELSGDLAIKEHRQEITPRDIQRVVHDDAELKHVILTSFGNSSADSLLYPRACVLSPPHTSRCDSIRNDPLSLFAGCYYVARVMQLNQDIAISCRAVNLMTLFLSHFLHELVHGLGDPTTVATTADIQACIERLFDGAGFLQEQALSEVRKTIGKFEEAVVADLDS